MPPSGIAAWGKRTRPRIEHRPSRSYLHYRGVMIVYVVDDALEPRHRPWIFGKKVMLPAGTIQGADHDERKVFVNRTKDQIKDAPEFEEGVAYDASYRGRLSSYYDRGGPGWRDWD